jgi:hypothetical protein
MPYKIKVPSFIIVEIIKAEIEAPEIEEIERVGIGG